MPITAGTLTVPDFLGTERKLKTLDDSADGSKNPAHPLLNTSGAFINPATSEKQDAGNASLATIATNYAASATAANQAEHNAKLDAIALNTLVGSLSVFATPAVTAAQYTSGMVVGGKIAVANASRANGGSGLVQQAAVCKKTTLTAALDLLVFHTNPAANFVDRQALPNIAADLPKLAGVIRCTEVVDCGTPQVLQALQQALQFRTPGDSSTLYVVPIMRGTETFATTDAVTVTLGILRD